MAGYMLQLYQGAHPAEYTKEAFYQYFKSAKEIKDFNTNVEHIMYGNFNRLEINPIDSFDEFRNISEHSRRWFGRRQRVLLYEIEEENRRLQYIQEKDGTVGFIGGKISGEKQELAKQNFLVFSMLSFTNEIIDHIIDFKSFIKETRKYIISIIDKAKEEAKEKTNSNLENILSVQCEVLGSFNTSEIALFILCNQYVDALRLIEFIRCSFIKTDYFVEKKCQVFFDSFSFVSKNRYKIASEDIHGYRIDRENDIYGKALFQISFKHNCSREEIKKLIDILNEPVFNVENASKDEVETLHFEMVGEQDLVTIMPAGRAMMYFQEKSKKITNNMGIFAFGNNEDGLNGVPWKDIIQVNIQLIYKQEESAFNTTLIDMEQMDLEMHIEKCLEKQLFSFVEKNSLPVLSIPKIKKGKTLEFKEEIFELYEKIRKNMEKRFTKSADAVNTLDLLYTDYLSTISYVYNAIWVLDFQHQFHTILKVIDSMLGDISEEMDQNWNWESYKDLINNFKQQIYHLSQSNRTFLEIPSCHTRYTGQQDYLLHAYFGIIKKILHIVYLTHEQTSQSELVPLITVDVAPIINSTLYYEGQNSIGTECRVINLNIPNAIIFDFPRGIAYLIHEIYHYVAPYNRPERNYLFTCIMLTEIRLRQINRILKKMYEDEKRKPWSESADEDSRNILSLTISFFREIIWNYMREHYLDIRKELGDSENVPLIFSKLLYAVGKYTYEEDNKKLGRLKEIFKLCLNELAQISDGFQYTAFCKYLGIDDSEMAPEHVEMPYMNILKYYYTDEKELDFFLNDFCTSINLSYSFSDKNTEIAEDVEWIYKQMWHGINEAIRDIAMIKTLDMSLAEYLIFVIQCWKDLNIPEVVLYKKKAFREEQICRLGSIFMYYLSDLKISEESEEQEYLQEQKYLKEQQKSFIWQYQMIYHRNFEYSKQKLVLEEAKEYWKKMYQARQEYRERYSFYDSYMKEMFFYTDIQKTIDILKKTDQEMAKEIEKLHKEFKIQVTEKYRVINQKFIEFFQSYQNFDENTTLKIYQEKYISYKKEIFACNLSIAHFFQNQETIQEIYNKYGKCQKKLDISNPERKRQYRKEIAKKKRLLYGNINFIRRKD